MLIREQNAAIKENSREIKSFKNMLKKTPQRKSRRTKCLMIQETI